MKELLSPNLYCPFVSQINKHVDTLERHALEWVLNFNLLANESSYKRFCKSKFFFLTASAYPKSQLEELKIANDWLSWVFIWDDQCDLSDLKNQPGVLKAFHQRYLEILNGAELTSRDTIFSHALIDLRQRTLQRASIKWFNYFISYLEDYFYGCVQEATNRAKGIVPDVDTYIMIRRSSVGVYAVLALAEFCNQFMISDVLRNHYLVKNLELITTDIIAWSNDIFSASREIASGDVHNLIFVLHHHKQISIEEAMEQVKKIHNEEINSLINLESLLPYYGEELDISITKYISGMHSWIRGNLDWCYQSSRYDILERLELTEFK
ncbi:terpene synthase family protein [Nostoc sp. UHCC 0252]|uniref:terpene synthase family protein n=1 Tax=Nostoc sp. UHCC 0252 TaxID=3110241 RepID=UPI002B20F8ED|nr:terpene synthase family protein [Nostoc sp. UHCC 0252]MEA5599881.1 terpene synthase family protein [Nostoc sp. UHCC 0252]